MKKVHHRFIGYNDYAVKGDKTSGIDSPVEITVTHHSSEANALRAVKKVVKREFYWLKDVWECKQCDYVESQQLLLRKFLSDIKKIAK